MKLIRSESIILTEGKSILDIRGSDFDAVLIIYGKPLLYQWCDCEGSIGQYLVYLSASNPSLSVNLFRAATQTAPNPDIPLANHMTDLMSLLAPGEYTLNLYVPNETPYINSFDAHWNIEADHLHYYPYESNFVTTQASSNLSEDRIKLYEEKINQGERPLVLTVSAAEGLSEFVIDGHHRLAAYERKQIFPHVLNIMRLHAPLITLDDMLSYIPKKHPLRGLCKKVKSAYNRS